MIGAFIFDLDGVLVDSETLSVAVEREALADLGLHYDRDDYIARFCGLPDADFLTQIAQDIAERGATLPADFSANLHQQRQSAYRDGLQAIAGAAAFSGQLDLPKAVASSSLTASLIDKLQMTGLHGLFAPHIYSTERVSRGKPAPDLFLYAAQQLGSDPAVCVVVEDSVNGVRAGVGAGMAVWGFIGGGHANARLGDRLRSAGASHVFEDYAAMQQHLAGPHVR